MDVTIGASMLALGAVAAMARGTKRWLEPVGALMPGLPAQLQPQRWRDSLGRRGALQRRAIEHDITRLLDALVPVLAEELVRRVDLTALVARHVDIDRIVALVDLQAAAARIDVNAVARWVDVDAVARRLDIGAVLDRLDLTALVVTRVDLDVLVRAVLERIDLVGVVEEVMEAIDLPKIIRDSTGSIAADSVRGARMQGIAADQAVTRVVNRLLLRRTRVGSAGTPTPRTGLRQP